MYYESMSLKFSNMNKASLLLVNCYSFKNEITWIGMLRIVTMLLIPYNCRYETANMNKDEPSSNS